MWGKIRKKWNLTDTFWCFTIPHFVHKCFQTLFSHQLLHKYWFLLDTDNQRQVQYMCRMSYDMYHDTEHNRWDFVPRGTSFHRFHEVKPQDMLLVCLNHQMFPYEHGPFHFDMYMESNPWWVCLPMTVLPIKWLFLDTVMHSCWRRINHSQKSVLIISKVIKIWKQFLLKNWTLSKWVKSYARSKMRYW